MGGLPQEVTSIDVEDPLVRPYEPSERTSTFCRPAVTVRKNIHFAVVVFLARVKDQWHVSSSYRSRQALGGRKMTGDIA